LAKNLQLLLTPVIPGMTTYGTVRLLAALKVSRIDGALRAIAAFAAADLASAIFGPINTASIIDVIGIDLKARKRVAVS